MTPLPTLLAALASTFTIVTFCYIFLCWVRPFTNCRHCHGTTRHTTRHTSRISGRSRPCRRCDHTGLRLRTGRRVCNHLARLHHHTTP
jgi:hypothetical protein